MHTFTRVFSVAGLAMALGGCLLVEEYKYAFTGKEAAPPPRTIEAAQQQFNDASLATGKATAADLQKVLGSPAEIRNENGGKVYVYYKSVATRGVSSDIGTAYIARYTFGRDGKLADKEYVAKPMGGTGLGT